MITLDALFREEDAVLDDELYKPVTSVSLMRVFKGGRGVVAVAIVGVLVCVSTIMFTVSTIEKSFQDIQIVCPDTTQLQAQILAAAGPLSGHDIHDLLSGMYLSLFS